MAVVSFQNSPQRIGALAGDILAHAEPITVLEKAGPMQLELPKNKSRQIIFRRWLPFGGVDNQWINTNNVDTFANNHLTVEGQTPTSDTITPVNVTATIQQYSCLYVVTDQVYDLHEDDIPAQLKIQVAERVAMVREMINYGVLRGATNKFFAGGASRATVSATLSLAILRKVVKNLMANHCKMVTKVLDASAKFDTSYVEAAYVAYCSTEMMPAIRDIPGFIPVAAYGTRKTVSDAELGSVENIRFVISPELAGYSGAGALVGTTGLQSVGGTNVDVFPVIVVGQDAWGTVAMRGLQALSPTWIVPGTVSGADPLGQRGFIGTKFYMTSLILNQGWMAVIEAGTPNL